MVYVIENTGTGDKAQFGQMLSVHYTGMLFKDGKKFDSSYDRNEPIEFPYSNGGLIPGFLEGLSLISQGGKAKLFLPYFLAYGSQEIPGIIPANSDLIFEIDGFPIKKFGSQGQQKSFLIALKLTVMHSWFKSWSVYA